MFEFLKETGEVSSTRVNAFLCVLCVIFYICYGVVAEKKVEVAIIFTLLTYAGGTKILQKKEEVKESIEEAKLAQNGGNQ